jgi:Zn-finger protein
MKQATECAWCHIATNELHPAATDVTITADQIGFTPVWLCIVCMARHDQQETERIASATPGSGNYPFAITFTDGEWIVSYSGPRSKH